MDKKLTPEQERILSFYKSAKGDLLAVFRELRDRPDTPDISDASCILLANVAAVFLTDINRLANAAEGAEKAIREFNETVGAKLDLIAGELRDSHME